LNCAKDDELNPKHVDAVHAARRAPAAASTCNSTPASITATAATTVVASYTPVNFEQLSVKKSVDTIERMVRTWKLIAGENNAITLTCANSISLIRCHLWGPVSGGMWR
jgi:hypothetical protein